MSLTDVFVSRRTSNEREAAARLVRQLWMEFTARFRDDERAHEAAAFTERAGTIAAELSALPDGQPPEPTLLRRMLEALVPAIGERIDDLHARVDDLDATIRTRDRDLQTQQLASSWMTDELERCRGLCMQALQGREVVMPAGNGGAVLISQLLGLVLNISVPPPRPQASEGRRDRKTDTAAPADAPPPVEPVGDRAVISQALREVLDGTAQAPRLARALEDPQLARRLADLFHEHRQQRDILQRLGILPKD